mgnify:FL=1
MKNEEIKKYIETLYNLFYASNRFYYKFAKQYGISDIALFTLNIIYNSKECIQNNLAEKLALPKQTVCSILDSFEKKGYVKREINPKDKRNRLISLTKKGIEFAKPIIEGLENLDINMLKCLSDEDIKNYVNYQKELIRFMENYIKN